MRRQAEQRSPLVEILVDRWRADGDERADELEAGRSVLVASAEIPPDYRFRDDDPSMGFEDDYELFPDGRLDESLAYWRRRFDEPAPEHERR